MNNTNNTTQLTNDSTLEYLQHQQIHSSSPLNSGYNSPDNTHTIADNSFTYGSRRLDKSYNCYKSANPIHQVQPEPQTVNHYSHNTYSSQYKNHNPMEHLHSLQLQRAHSQYQAHTQAQAQAQSPPPQPTYMPSFSSKDNILGSLSHHHNKHTLYNAKTYTSNHSANYVPPPSSTDTATSPTSYIPNSSNGSIGTEAHIPSTSTTATTNPSSMSGQSVAAGTSKATKSPPHDSHHHSHIAAIPENYYDDTHSTTPSTNSSTRLKSKSSWRKGLKNVLRKSSYSSRSSLNEAYDDSITSAQQRMDKLSLSPQHTQNSLYSTVSKRPQLTQSSAASIISHQSTATTTTTTSQAAPYGLISRSDDTRLRDSLSARTEYFESIQVRFLVYCSYRSQKHLEYAESITPSAAALDRWSLDKAKLLSSSPTPNSSTLASIEMSLRQLREAVLTLPTDDLTVEIFVYSVQVSAMEGHHEAYVPSFQYIMNTLHPEVGLDDDQFKIIFELYILHVLHFSNDSVQAFDILGEHFAHDGTNRHLWELVRVWVERDYLRWRRLYDAEENIACKRIMSMGELVMAKEALNRISTSYMGMPQSDLETTLGMSWERIVTELNCSWRRDDSGMIHIKERGR